MKTMGIVEYVIYLFTPEDSSEWAGYSIVENSTVWRKIRGIGKLFFWVLISIGLPLYII